MFDLWGLKTKKENMDLLASNASWVKCNKRYFELAQSYCSSQNSANDFMGKRSSISCPDIEVTNKYSAPSNNFIVLFLCCLDIFGIIQHRRNVFLKKQKELLLRENESLQQMAAEGLEMQIVSNTIEHGSKAQLKWKTPRVLNISLDGQLQ